MGSLWVVFVAALCVLGNSCEATEPVLAVAPCPPPAPPPCVTQTGFEPVPAGTVLPLIADVIEEVISPLAPAVVSPPTVTAALPPPVFVQYPLPMVYPQYLPPGLGIPNLPPSIPAPCDSNPAPFAQPAASPCAAPAPNPTPFAQPAAPPCAAPAPNPAPCAQPAIPPIVDEKGDPLTLPTPLSFPLPVPKPFPSSSIFSVLSQAQNGDPNEALLQISKMLASTLPTAQLQAAASFLPPPQDPIGVPVAAPASALPAATPPTTASPGCATPLNFPPVSFLGPLPKILNPPSALDLSKPADVLDLPTLAFLEQQAARGLIKLNPEVIAQIALASTPSDPPAPVEAAPEFVEAAPAPVPFDLPKFGQATKQFLSPWSRAFDPLRRLNDQRYI